MKIAITGASGHLGHRVAELVLDATDAPGDVVLVTRRPEGVADLAARGAEVRPADYGDPAALRAAFAGAQRILLVSTDVVGRREVLHGNAVAAAAAVDPELVAYTSVTRPDEDNPAFVVPEHRATEAALRASGAPWTALRNNLYLETQLGTFAGAAASGQLFSNAGEGRVRYVAREDCAAAAAAVLLGGDHAGRAYDIAGPEALDPAAIAAILADATGREIVPVLVDDAGYVEGLARAGLPRPLAESLATLGQAARAGKLDPLGSDVEALTGRPPQDLASFLRTHREALDG